MPVGFPVPSSHPDSAHTVTCKCHSNRDRNQSRLLRETVMAAASTAPSQSPPQEASSVFRGNKLTPISTLLRDGCPQNFGIEYCVAPVPVAKGPRTALQE